MTALSGGQAARVGLAALLLSRFDVLLLDEPTNDLDLDGLDRLERFVNDAAHRHRRGLPRPGVPGPLRHHASSSSISPSSRSACTAAATRPTWPSARWPAGTPARRTRSTPTGATSSRSGPDAARLDGQRHLRKQAIARQQGQRQDRPRPSGSSRPRSRPRRSRQTERMIERLPEVAEPRKEWQLRSTPSRRAGRSGLGGRDPARRRRPPRGDFTLGPVSLQVDLGDRIGVTGPNGGGKSTLLAMLLGPLRADSRVRRHSVPVCRSARSTRPGGC